MVTEINSNKKLEESTMKISESKKNKNNKKKLKEGRIYKFLGDEFTSRVDAENAVENYADEHYDEWLDEIYGDVEICGLTYSSSYALKEIDPIAYRVGVSDFADSLYDDIEEDWEDEEVTISVTDIEWDIDEGDVVNEDLPTQYDVDIEVEDGDDESDINDKIQEVLEDEFGWGVRSLSFDPSFLEESVKPIKEAPYYELSPRYDSRKSFYGKAHVDTGDNDDKNKLYSYDTLVAEIKDGKPVVYGTYSATTLRHIKDWLKQNGFKAETSKQIMQDYGVNESLKEGWRGSPDIEMGWNGEWADPDLIYKDYTFNYWDIEDALWDMFKEDMGYSDSEANNPDVEEQFGKYIRQIGPSYLDDVIAGGYFTGDSKDWHDAYKK